MRKINILLIIIMALISAESASAAISDDFTATETQAYAAEVKASVTLLFDDNATDGDLITVGACDIHFNSSGTADYDCSDGGATLTSFSTAADVNAGFDQLTNITDSVNGHGTLTVDADDATHTKFTTAGTETADGPIYVSGAHNNGASISTQIDGVVKKDQKISFTPANVSPEGGVRFTSQLGGISYFYETTAAHHSIKEIVEYLQPNMNGNADFTCTEDDTKVECTATNNQANSFSASVLDVAAPTKSGNIGKAVDENTSGVVVDIPNEITITDADSTLTYTIDNTYRDWDDFSINSTTGELSFVNPNGPDYENPTDTSVSGSNTYGVEVWVSDSAGNSLDVYVDINVNDISPEAPVITSPNTVSVPENQTSVMQVVAHDDDGDTVTYSLGSGLGAPDMSSFHIDSATGVLTFVNAPDYENPTDRSNSFGTGARDNIYVVVVLASDGSHTTTQNLLVTVTDVAETPARVGKSSRSHSSKSGKRACKDSKALNFSSVGQHDQSLCVYGVKKEEGVKKESEEKGSGEKAEEKMVAVVISGKCMEVQKYGKLVRFGQRGQAVKDLQEYLKEQGINPGPVDGIFGRLTGKAVKE